MSESSWKYEQWRKYKGHGYALEDRGWDNGTYRWYRVVHNDDYLGECLLQAYRWIDQIADPDVREKMGVPEVELVQKTESDYRNPFILHHYHFWRVTVGYVERKKLLPHPLSKQSYKKIMRKVGKALQIVEAGPLNNCTCRIDGTRVTVSKQYHDAIETLKRYRERIQRIERS